MIKRRWWLAVLGLVVIACRRTRHRSGAQAKADRRGRGRASRARPPGGRLEPRVTSTAS